MELAEVTIAGRTFNLRSPYSEGDPLTAGAASQLNQVRHENVRNNCAKLVKDWKGSDEELNAKVDEYDAAYEFAVRVPGEARAPSDPITTEARALARIAIKAALDAAGQKVDGKTMSAAIEALLKHEIKGPQLRAAAEERVAERQRIAASTVGEINIAALVAAAPAPEAPAAA